MDKILTRSFEGAVSINEEDRTIEVSFSSEQPYQRYYPFEGIEILGHDPKEVDLSRLNASGVVLRNHGGLSIGIVVRSWIEQGRGKAIIKLSEHEIRLWDDIKAGIIRNISVGYIIDQKTLIKQSETAGQDEYRITRWIPYEISIVDIPADHTVGIGRSADLPTLIPNQQPNKEEVTMPPNTKALAEKDISPISPTDADPIKATRHLEDTTPKVDIAQIETEATKRALEQESNRQSAIRSLFDLPVASGKRDLLDACLTDQKITVDLARQQLLESVNNDQAEPLGAGAQARVGESDREKSIRAISEELYCRAGLQERKEHSAFRSMSLLEMAKDCLQRQHSNVEGNRIEIVGRAFHSTSDFTQILANVSNKSLLKGYDEAEEVFMEFTSKGNLSDFKIANRVGLTQFQDLALKNESGEYKSGTIGDKGETIQLASYGRIFRISREAILNDDLSVMTTIPRKMGAAAKRTVGNIVFDAFIANPDMADGNALFHASHHNIKASGGALSVANLSAGKTAMTTQKEGAARLNIRPYALLVPWALESEARVIMDSDTDPTQSNSKKPNPVKKMVKVIADGRLDDDNIANWYLVANPNIHDVIEVAYLDGVESPYMEQKMDFDTDGVSYKVRMDAAAKALDWRTHYKSVG